MPCYRCGARQTDPERGPSPWQRGVRVGHQVLVCPECQRSPDYLAELDRCTSCGATRLVSGLGEVRCRSCGAVEEVTDGGGERPGEGAPGLAEDVAAAVRRLLRREPDAPG